MNSIRMRLLASLSPMVRMRPAWALNPSAAIVTTSRRLVRHQAFDAGFDPEELAEARRWHKSFHPSTLPQGDTSFSRSSGPGGQHVNKTETKATTTWPISKLIAHLPKILHAELRHSKYYTRGNDSITIQAQTERSRSANQAENHQKLYDELINLYAKTVPAESSPDKARKYEALKKTARETRLKEKKFLSSKKQSRKSGGSDY
ncbi:hypothetical protein GE21DRAFT_10427 [Neurospora crassa]|uniref:Prokaryotic-type class I peptide chain release factors domain-containing protein n=1 Tax=Neurospora crassa (strain ATCC 24698 / 74-OR23-1A / CBS 708.71 / DSM 1257 / FGSC 987) TaxID=367110 RepID=V5IKF9_NEUCR|nr:hypothetical protein NCU02285 [Neurospora crassa OR74A]ESA42008.1 hypothetical protein NCU02285 [Neurospora crassa OR74A]KHE84839.1 hypothetical protein GE21DRAFT_10427 [Neurospora crassa]|eukprot:XP_011395130.1 hypothetical protein NCU02285 [Neurospora crassa OR74A]